LYINDSRGDYVVAFDVQPDGSLSNRRNFAKYQIDDEMRKTFPYQSDGLCVDAAGRVYVAMPLSVQVFSPKGEFLGRIPVTKKVQNLAFAGTDRRSLYIVAQGSIWKVRTLTDGPRDRAK
jgi:gluconolactonase